MAMPPHGWLRAVVPMKVSACFTPVSAGAAVSEDLLLLHGRRKARGHVLHSALVEEGPHGAPHSKVNKTLMLSSTKGKWTTPQYFAEREHLLQTANGP